jgi:cell division protein FtsA
MTLMTFRAMLGIGGGDAAPRKPVCASLDIGTHKIACVIAKVRSDEGGHRIKVVGVGHHESRGVKAGIIVDLAAAEHAIREAVDAAERMAGLTVDEVVVNASCGRIASEVYEIGVPVPTAQVRQEDLDRVLRTARSQPRQDGRMILHSVPLGFCLDGSEGVGDPRGMYGDRLSVGMHVVTVDPGPLRNLALGVDRAHVKIDRVAVSPLASALATLTEDEADLGAVCIDMGAGCTTLALFMDGMFVHADAVALGGRHVTLDLARALSTPLAEAERIKNLHGSVLADAHDTGAHIEVPLVGDAGGEEMSRVPRSAINRVIRPRVEETFELLNERLVSTGFGGRGDRHIVLTGGASQLTGVDEAASRILGGHVRLGAPGRLAGASEAISGPDFATAAGLLTYAQAAELEPRSALSQRSLKSQGGYLARVGRWLKESF